MINPYLNGSVSHATLRDVDLLAAFADALETLTRANHVTLGREKVRRNEMLIEDARSTERYLSLSPSHYSHLTGAARTALEKRIARTNDEAPFIINEELFDALNEFADEGYYFGSHPGDGSDFGFWKIDDDEDRISCDRCQMLSINGIPCHETGCPNMRKVWVDGEWVDEESEDEDFEY